MIEKAHAEQAVFAELVVGDEADADLADLGSTDPDPIQFGELDRVRVGTAEIRKVRVGFIADDKIGENSLLGMSFLDHFRMTIDDANNRLTLVAK